MARYKNPLVGIYMIISPTGRIYIGQSRCIQKRKSDYKSLHNCNEQPILFNSLKKYGWERHYFCVVCQCSIDQLNFWEDFYIQAFKKMRITMNVRNGGHSPLPTDVIRKISIANTGKKHSVEARQKMSLAKKGSTPWNKGKKGLQSRPHSIETRLKISQTKKNRYKK